MTIDIRTPELERLMQEEILSGHFSNAEELITEAIHALRERKATGGQQEARSPRRMWFLNLAAAPFRWMRT